MWQAVQYVTSGFTLCAFIVAAIAYVIKLRLQSKRELISTAPDADRAALVAKTLEFFDVDTRRLPAQQQYGIAMQQIDARMERFRIVGKVVVILAVIGGVVSVSLLAIARDRPVTSTGKISQNLPTVIRTCDYPRYNYCNTMTWNKDHYDFIASNGQTGKYTVLNFNGDSVTWRGTMDSLPNYVSIATGKITDSNRIAVGDWSDNLGRVGHFTAAWGEALSSVPATALH